MKRQLSILFLLISLLLLGDVCAYALTPAEKRAKAKAKIERKREAAKRKAERKKAAKLKAAKRQRIKDGKPLLYVYTYNLQTGEPLPATHITLQDVNARPNKKPKISKPTDTKRARVSKGLPEGKYWAVAAKTGYFTSDTVIFRHKEDEDTLKIAIYPETRLTFTVTDSLTSRPVVANIVVRNHQGARVMQTTSDSMHNVLAVLLDDRIPFYTVEATAVHYFPYRDTISFPLDFQGVVMSPREVKSFVLHNIYFATGKTHILPSSESALNELYLFLHSRPNQHIRIVGHTDNIGSDRSNQILSEGRCQEVKQAMIARGIASERIEVEGRGERDPIVPNDSDEHRQMNRRVEIVLQ
ncbi:MAG: OmpA family protein [Paludibacteraceae bacterium]|nr:OmpA family protein [Paludibacteraceae bacterium]